MDDSKSIGNWKDQGSYIQQLEEMEVKSLLRNNTMSLLNRKATLKALKPIKKNESEKEIKDIPKLAYESHHAFKFIRGTAPSAVDFKKFVTLLYRGLSYSVYNLKGPSEEFIKKKKVKLPELDAKRKMLMLDLDQTLIHSVFTADKTDVKFTRGTDEFKFNIRPHCYEFLESMSEIYNVYVFTAGTQDYAEPIVEYLNKKKKTIQGVLHRKNCMETHNGFYIKDLRIISNRSLESIIIVDNLVHSFGLQLTNGIPILEFTSNKLDKELISLGDLLKTLSEVEDVRPVIKQKIQVEKCLEIEEATFVNIDSLGKDKK